MPPGPVVVLCDPAVTVAPTMPVCVTESLTVPAMIPLFGVSPKLTVVVEEAVTVMGVWVEEA